MDKRYQVFVSSTYADLKEERRHVIQALMEMDCIPAGMELFPAADEEQWEFIKRVIDDCDYYLLIIGGRYGSTTAEGISYTEKEFDYAVEKGLKVIALLHGTPETIPVAKSEMDPALRDRLDSFREKVKTGRLIRYWNALGELPGLVALSLQKTIKMYPATGWVRGNAGTSQVALLEINDLRRENAELTAKVSSLRKKLRSESEALVAGLAGLDEKFEMHLGRLVVGGTIPWSSTMTWRDIFAAISPYLIASPLDSKVKKIIEEAAAAKAANQPKHGHVLDDQDFQTISVHLKALGLVNITYSRTTKGGMALFWELTSRGERLMLQLRTVAGTAARDVTDFGDGNAAR